MREIAFATFWAAIVIIGILACAGIVRRIYTIWLFKKNGVKIYYGQLLMGDCFILCGCGHPSWRGDFVQSNGRSKWLIWTLKTPMPYCHMCLSEMSYVCRCSVTMLAFDKALIVGNRSANTWEIICGGCLLNKEEVLATGIWNPPFVEIDFEETSQEPDALPAPITEISIHPGSTRLH